MKKMNLNWNGDGIEAHTILSWKVNGEPGSSGACFVSHHLGGRVGGFLNANGKPYALNELILINKL